VAGLSDEQIAIYAKPEFDWRQMWQIRLGQEDGLSAEQIAMYANPKFNWEKMMKIRQKLEKGKRK